MEPYIVSDQGGGGTVQLFGDVLLQLLPLPLSLLAEFAFYLGIPSKMTS